MTTPEDTWTTRLHAAVDDHPAALAFDVPSYVAAGRKRVRRNRTVAVVAAAAAVAVVAGAAAVASRGTDRGAPQPASPVVPSSVPIAPPGTNGWIAVDAYDGGGDIFLFRPGEQGRRLEVAGPDDANDACPVWSPDGTRLMFGRVSGAGGPELVIVPMSRDGEAGTPTTIGLGGFEVLPGFDPHPCAIWAPDGRWVAFAGTGELWVVDTETSEIRRLPDLRPSDLDWRPGTDELTIAGDLGEDRGDPVLSAAVSVYSVSTGELRPLGSVEAAHLTWSPDGTMLAYAGGEEPDAQGLWLVDADGANERLLVADTGEANHGIGPVWSPTGERIAYQRLLPPSAEGHEVVLVDVADGTETVIKPPEVDGHLWYPYVVTWSPDGTTLLYPGWRIGKEDADGVIAVHAEPPHDPTVLTDAIAPAPNNYSHQWAPTQMWGRQPG